jgi:hypothetical protein
MPFNNYQPPLKAGENGEARNCQNARQTRKRFTSKNDHNGHLQTTQIKGPAYDPNDITRTTIKQQLIDNTREGNINPQQPSKPTVYDPNDIAKTTIKEQFIDNTHEGFMQPEEQKSYVYDPNDVPKTTMKEQLIDNTHEGFMQPEEQKSYVYDPNDVAKTTIKEQFIDDNRLGIAHGKNKMKCRDPNDKVKTTIKETTITQDVVGPMYQKKGLGYNIAANDIKNTIRQFTSDYEYTGTANSKHKKPQSYEQIYNSTVKSMREQVSRGRAPTNSGAKKYNHEMNLTTKKLGDIHDKYLTERGLTPNKVYNSIPQVAICGTTKDKFTAPNEPIQDRLDTSILDQLKTNPYTMPHLAAVKAC